MGRRALSAVGMAAAAMMQCPADSFLGSPSVPQPLVQRNGSASPPTSTAAAGVAAAADGRGADVNDSSNGIGSALSPTLSPSPPHAARAWPLSRGGRAGLRRPAAWRLPSVRGGGGAGAEEGAAAGAAGAAGSAGAARRGDAGGVDTDR